MNSIKNGRIGEAAVALEFAKMGYDVYMPTFGNGECDMLVLKDGVVSRVEVKSTSSQQKSGRYTVMLKSVRPNKTENVIRKFDGSRSDILAVHVIPTGRVHIFSSKEFDGMNQTTVDG